MYVHVRVIIALYIYVIIIRLWSPLTIPSIVEMCITYYKIDNGTMTIFLFSCLFFASFYSFSLFHFLWFGIMYSKRCTSKLSPKVVGKIDGYIVRIISGIYCYGTPDLQRFILKNYRPESVFWSPMWRFLVVPDEYLRLISYEQVVV